MSTEEWAKKCAREDYEMFLVNKIVMEVIRDREKSDREIRAMIKEVKNDLAGIQVATILILVALVAGSIISILRP